MLKKAREKYDEKYVSSSSIDADDSLGVALGDKEIPGAGKKKSNQKRSIVPSAVKKASKRKRLSRAQNNISPNAMDNIIACQPIGNEASFLSHRSELTDIAEMDDMSLDSGEGDYDLELMSAYKADEEEIGLGIDKSQEDEKDVLNIEWNFQDFTGEKDIGLKPTGKYATEEYNGTDRLKPEAKMRAMDTVMECVEEFGGLDKNYFARLTNHSNAYAEERKKGSSFAGSTWSRISCGEMIRFHGILLRMSIDGRKVGGYETYFSQSKSYVQVTDRYVRKLPYLEPWASKMMTFKRFKQIRAAYHHEKTKSSNDDRCWQIRYVLNKLNATSRKTFIPAKHLSFDEGGIACRSRYCIIRIYNPSKPDPYRVEYFVLSSSTFPYEVIYIDIYQGANESPIGVVNEHKGFPLTQRVVLDAVLKSRISKDELGYRTILLDNRYACPELLVNLLFRYEVRAAGTCRANRIGWQKDKFTMPKNATRGSILQQYDEKNQLLEIQWKDSKVVGFVSTIERSGTTTVKRQSGPNKIDVTCPPAIRDYGKYMGGVDQGDYYRKKSGGFAGKSHF